jgi:hypothetical protein
VNGSSGAGVLKRVLWLGLEEGSSFGCRRQEKTSFTHEGTSRGDKKLLDSDCFYPVDPSE